MRFYYSHKHSFVTSDKLERNCCLKEQAYACISIDNSNVCGETTGNSRNNFTRATSSSEIYIYMYIYIYIKVSQGIGARANVDLPLKKRYCRTILPSILIVGTHFTIFC